MVQQLRIRCTSQLATAKSASGEFSQKRRPIGATGSVSGSRWRCAHRQKLAQKRWLPDTSGPGKWLISRKAKSSGGQRMHSNCRQSIWSFCAADGDAHLLCIRCALHPPTAKLPSRDIPSELPIPRPPFRSLVSAGDADPRHKSRTLRHYCVDRKMMLSCCF